jgi:hypothetical protein
MEILMPTESKEVWRTKMSSRGKREMMSRWKERIDYDNEV